MEEVETTDAATPSSVSINRDESTSDVDVRASEAGQIRLSAGTRTATTDTASGPRTT